MLAVATAAPAPGEVPCAFAPALKMAAATAAAVSDASAVAADNDDAAAAAVAAVALMATFEGAALFGDVWRRCECCK